MSASHAPAPPLLASAAAASVALGVGVWASHDELACASATVHDGGTADIIGGRTALDGIVVGGNAGITGIGIGIAVVIGIAVMDVVLSRSLAGGGLAGSDRLSEEAAQVLAGVCSVVGGAADVAVAGGDASSGILLAPRVRRPR